MKHRRRERGENMNKKYLLAVLAVALAAIVSVPAIMSTWVSCTITMHAGTGVSGSIGQFTDCLCTTPINTYDWGELAQGTNYQCPIYIKNTGNLKVQLFWYAYPLGANAYIPIGTGVYPGGCDIAFNSNQVVFNLKVQVIQEPGNPCQLPLLTPGPYICCKFEPNAPWNVKTTGGYDLEPGKVIKVDVQLHTNNLVGGATYDFKLVFDALTY